MRKRLLPLVALCAAVPTGLSIFTVVASAQPTRAESPQDRKPTTAPKAQKTEAAAPAATPPQPIAAPPGPKLSIQPGSGWVSRCVSDSRQSAVECSIEQTATLSNSGQLLASVVIRVPADTHQPVMMVQVPVGLYLPAGLSLQIDDGKPQPLVLQTCDLKGCYAGAPFSTDLLDAMKAGKRLVVTFQNLAKESINVPLTLDNFAEAYQRIQ